MNIYAMNPTAVGTPSILLPQSPERGLQYPQYRIDPFLGTLVYATPKQQSFPASTTGRQHRPNRCEDYTTVTTHRSKQARFRTSPELSTVKVPKSVTRYFRFGCFRSTNLPSEGHPTTRFKTRGDNRAISCRAMTDGHNQGPWYHEQFYSGELIGSPFASESGSRGSNATDSGSPQSWSCMDIPLATSPTSSRSMTIDDFGSPPSLDGSHPVAAQLEAGMYFQAPPPSPFNTTELPVSGNYHSYRIYPQHALENPAMPHLPYFSHRHEPEHVPSQGSNALDIQEFQGLSGLPTVPPLVCNICSEVFQGNNGTGNLQRHKRSKHRREGDPKPKCDVCHKSFNRGDAIPKHKERKHGVPMNQKVSGNTK
ncbi:hypothetical protein CC78DRAFT_584013 [Lojkania enalia]|uniref:C2H2-type domain-containing protein n=1 Tax=Lojkania enalia TaxID=147567 RepID=A0A9P4N3V9_9PLEO|nr:hypothetical protein CC78DRAFT_584013 [Didymosphaeria enalia]